MLMGQCRCFCSDGQAITLDCDRLAWRWCTLTSVSVSGPSGWNPVGSWDPAVSDSSQWYEYVPDQLYSAGTVVELPGIRFEPVEFAAGGVAFNGANSWYDQRYDLPYWYPAHGVAYWPAWEQNRWGGVFSSDSTVTSSRISGADHVTRNNSDSAFSYLKGLYVPVCNQNYLSKYFNTQNNQIPLPNSVRIKHVRLVSDGSPVGDWVELDCAFELFRLYISLSGRERVDAHNVVMTRPFSGDGYLPELQQLPFTNCHGTAVGIDVCLEMKWGFSYPDGEVGYPGDPLPLVDGYRTNPFPVIHVQPGGLTTPDAITESSGSLGFVGPTNEDFDYANDSYKFTSQDGPTFPLETTWGDQDDDFYQRCLIGMYRLFTLNGRDYSWRLEFRWGAQHQASWLTSDPILLGAGHCPTIRLQVSPQARDLEQFPLNQDIIIYYVPENIDSLGEGTFTNDRGFVHPNVPLSGTTHWYWQQQPGPFYPRGTTMFVPAWRGRANTVGGGFSPYQYQYIPNKIAVKRVDHP